MSALFPRAVPLTAVSFMLLCPFVAQGFQTPAEIVPRIPADPRTAAARQAAARQAAAREEGSAPEPYLRVDASMVLVPTQVTTPTGAPLTTLGAEDFRVYEDGAEQSIRYFTRDEAPLSVGVLVDSSASMKNKTRRSAEAAAALLRASNAADEFFVIEFDEKPRLQLPFTTDPDAVYREISDTRPFGRTSLFDAIHLALQTMRKAQHSRKALVILSDGGDNHSRRSFSTLRDAVAESDVAIYAVGIYEPEGSASASKEEERGPDLLSQIAELTGGRHFSTRLADLASVSARVGELMHHQYLIGYTPQNDARDGTFRTIRLELPAKEDSVSLRYRKGYRAPLR